MKRVDRLGSISKARYVLKGKAWWLVFFWPEDGFEIWKSLEESDQVERTMRKEEWPSWNFHRNFAFLPTLPSGADFFLIEHNSQIIKFTIKFTVQCFFFPHIFTKLCDHHAACSVAQSFLTPCYPMDCSPPDSSVHRISQARTVECVAISYSIITI